MNWGRGRIAYAAAVCTVLMSVLAGGVLGGGGAPARADDGWCWTYDVGYGITASGALAEHAYCTEANSPTVVGGQASSQLAPAGWWLGGPVFSSGVSEYGGGHQAAAIYQVAPDGRLLWYTDAGEHHLGTASAVGAAFGDWRRYRSLFSPGAGLIYGIDPSGQLLRWQHDGYTFGYDTWTGPVAVAHGFTGREAISGVTDDDARPFFGTDPASPHTVTYWGADGHVAAREPVLGSPLAAAPSWGGAIGGYGRDRDGRMVRITAHPPAQPTAVQPNTFQQPGAGSTTTWDMHEVLHSGRYVRVIGGGQHPVVAVSPYEWQ
jgi:hypothetical protein